MGTMHDIFICHASEDKEQVVRPIVKALTDAGISVWFDELKIKWGDSLTKQVNEALRISRFVIVVLSPVFLTKNWPERELNAALNIEASTGETKLLPLLVGSEEEKRVILQTYPLLNDKKYLSWTGSLEEIVGAMLARLGKRGEGTKPDQKLPPAGLKIPMPKIKKAFSQREKDQFLKDTFATIKAYFKEGLSQLERSHKEIETDFTEIHNFKFVSKIYIHGQVKSQCKIWVGGILSSDSIAYQSGRVDFEGDNSMNDWLTIEQGESGLVWKPSGMGFGRHSQQALASKEEAAEYFWRRFTEDLA